MKYFTSSLLFCLSVTAVAVERPTLPATGEDLALTGGLSAKDFFAGRAAQTDCRASLESARASWQAAKDALATLISQGAAGEDIDAKEAEMNDLRNAYLDRIEDCGDCATHPVEAREIPTGERTQYWFITDGSCYVGDLAGGYERAKASLRDIRQYAKKTGGFSSLLEFVAIDPLRGTLLPEKHTIDKLPAYFFVGLKGAEAFGVTAGYTQVIKMTESVSSAGGVSATHARWQAMRPPRGFTAPPVYVYYASGRTKPALVTAIPAVLSSWYLTSDGYMRYYLAADFGTNLSFATSLARRILQDTIVTMSERYRGR